MAVRPDFLNAPVADVVEKSAKESNEARFIRLASSVVDLNCEVSKPSGGKGHNSHFIRVKAGDEELFAFNIGVLDESNHGLTHNKMEAKLLRDMARALLDQAARTEEIIDLTVDHMRSQAERKVKQIREKLDSATTPAARRDVIKAFKLHSPEMESIPNGKRFDEAVEELLNKMVTFEK